VKQVGLDDAVRTVMHLLCSLFRGCMAAPSAPWLLRGIANPSEALWALITLLAEPVFCSKVEKQLLMVLSDV
jgi:hypothetical protein